MALSRIPKHVGIIPDGNRRWAAARGLAKSDGYEAGVSPGLRLLTLCRELGIAEVSVYGFTKENVRRARDQVEAFRASCVQFALAAVQSGAAVLAVGDTTSSVFPDPLRPYTVERSPGDIRVNLLVNYGWQWDLASAGNGRDGRDGRDGHDGHDGRDGRDNGRRTAVSRSSVQFASAAVPRIDLVVRWGGRSRLSGFLPIQCAYADIYVIDALWPDMQPDSFADALRWYEEQDVTMGG